MRTDSPKPIPVPDLSFERAARRRGATTVCGVDEVGRGPLAGPVVVAAVILPRKIVGLNDSKLLSAEQRETLYEQIMEIATVAVAVAPPSVIARLNILWATMWAMRQAVLTLAVKPDFALIDGNRAPKDMPCPSETVVRGDSRSMSIAAASIVAKVTRDRMCQIMHCEEPHFGFDSHKGYAAPVHLKALTEQGPGRHHRLDFAPCAQALKRHSDAA